MNLPEAEDGTAFKPSSVLAKCRDLWNLAPSKLWCLMSPQTLFGRMEPMEQTNGLKEVTDPPWGFAQLHVLWLSV